MIVLVTTNVLRWVVYGIEAIVYAGETGEINPFWQVGKHEVLKA